MSAAQIDAQLAGEVLESVESILAALEVLVCDGVVHQPVDAPSPARASRMVRAVRKEMVEYVITFRDEPVAVLRPFASVVMKGPLCRRP